MKAEILKRLIELERRVVKAEREKRDLDARIVRAKGARKTKTR